MRKKEQTLDDQDRSKRIEKRDDIEWHDRTSGQIADDEGRTDDIEKGKTEGGGAL